MHFFDETKSAQAVADLTPEELYRYLYGFYRSSFRSRQDVALSHLHYAEIFEDRSLQVSPSSRERRGVIGLALSLEALDVLAKQEDFQRDDLKRVRRPEVRRIFEAFVDDNRAQAEPGARSVFFDLGDKPEQNLRTLEDAEDLDEEACILVAGGVPDHIRELVAGTLGQPDLKKRTAASLEFVLFGTAAKVVFPRCDSVEALRRAQCVAEHFDLFTRDEDVRRALMGYRGDENELKGSRYRILFGQLQLAPDDDKTSAADTDIVSIGTTSFIVRCKDPDDATYTRYAVKCVLPRYWHTAVHERAHAYKVKYAKLKAVLGEHVPAIHQSEEIGIRMEFIAGPTLARAREQKWQQALERVEKGLRGRLRLTVTAEDVRDRRRLSSQQLPDGAALPELILDSVNDVFCAVAEQLEELATTREPPRLEPDDPPLPRAHLDLSPDNIILQDELWEDVALIDFGANFVLTENIGVGGRFGRALTFMAPELQIHPDMENYRCDVYSLGVIALEICSTEHVTDQGHLRERLAILWERAPEVARVVENMIDAKPSNRLVGHRASETCEQQADAFDSEAAGAYADLSHRFSHAVEIEKERIPNMPRGVRAALWHLRRLLRLERPELRDRYLKGWARVYRWIWWLTLLAFADIAARNWHVITDVWEPPALFSHFMDQAVKTGGHHQSPHDYYFHHILPSQLVALSTALICISYYLFIFAGIAVPNTKNRWLQWARWVVRIAPLVALLLQFAAVIYNLPLAVAAGAGGLLIAANNFVWLGATKNAEREADTHRLSTVGQNFKDWREAFSAWWWLMLVYSAGGIAIGLLLRFGVAKDIWVYAIVLALFINFLKLWVYNIVRASPQARGNLTRAVFILQREEARRRNPTSPVSR